MSEQVEYNIHSLVGVKACGDAAMLANLDLHLAPFRGDSAGCAEQIIIDRYDDAPAPDRAVVIDDIDCGNWTFHRAATRVWMEPIGTPGRYFMDSLALPINLIVQLALLRQGRTFTHAAAIEFGGRGILLPAYPGTGKTTTSASLVRAGAKFFGDDLCIVGDSVIRSYPQALSVYPHHLAILDYDSPELKREFKRAERADRARSRIDQRGDLPSKVASRALGYIGTRCANVMPDEVFGKSSVGTEVALDVIALLQRSGEVDTLTLRDIDPRSAAEQASVVLWHEWHGFLHELMLLDAVNTSGTWLRTMFEQTTSILFSQFTNRPCYSLTIPASWGNERLRDEFPAFVDNIA